jgi:ribosomal protein S27AE
VSTVDLAETESDDVERVECPRCGAHNSLAEPDVEGLLVEGFRYECGTCSATIRVSAVDYEVTVYCQVAP